MLGSLTRASRFVPGMYGIFLGFLPFGCGTRAKATQCGSSRSSCGTLPGFSLLTDGDETDIIMLANLRGSRPRLARVYNGPGLGSPGCLVTTSIQERR